MKVLVIESDYDLAESLKLAINNLGAEVDIAFDIKTAAKLLNYHYDLILADHMLLKVSGNFDILSKVKSNSVVVLSSLTPNETKELKYNHIQKPFGLKEIEDYINPKHP
jgi:DNA-binding response OmpR family regulator